MLGQNRLLGQNRIFRNGIISFQTRTRARVRYSDSGLVSESGIRTQVCPRTPDIVLENFWHACSPISDLEKNDKYIRFECHNLSTLWQYLRIGTKFWYRIFAWCRFGQVCLRSKRLRMSRLFWFQWSACCVQSNQRKLQWWVFSEPASSLLKHANSRPRVALLFQNPFWTRRDGQTEILN